MHTYIGPPCRSLYYYIIIIIIYIEKNAFFLLNPMNQKIGKSDIKFNVRIIEY